MDIGLLPELFARQAARTPQAPAIINDAGTISYAELADRTGRLAALLRAAGAGPDCLVGVCLPRGVNLVVALLAVWQAGAAYVPLDPDHPRERLRGVLADTGAGLLLTESGVADGLADHGVATMCLDRIQAELDTAPVAVTPADVGPDHAAYAIFTSGSTGRPKGVLVSHAAIANRVMWTVRTHALGSTDRVLQKTTMSFDAAGWEIFAPLVSGGAVVLAPVAADRDPAGLLRATASHGVTVLQVVPSLLRLLVDEAGWADCDSLRLLFCAGEPLHAELCQRVWARLPGVGLWNTYGPTECAIDITAHEVDPMQLFGPVPIGRPITNTRVLVLDPSGDPAPVGVPGELFAGGVGMARGYLGLPALTAQSFGPDPYGPAGSRIYRTGDRVRWRGDGTLEYLGRLDHQVKVNGVRVEPGDVEAALAAHPDVRAAVVTTVLDVHGGYRLAAYVVSRNGELPSPVLRRFLHGRLPPPLIPSVFVRMDALPLTPSGKVDRAALPEPERHERAGRPAHVSPRTPAEMTVAQVWTRLLAVEGVGTQDDFFSLGGSSLLLTKLASRLGAAYGREVSVQDLFTASTVEQQAALLDGPEAGLPTIRPVPREGPLPLSFGQQQLWFLDRMDPGSPEWVTPLVTRLPGSLAPDTVGQALKALVARHEILRTRYVLDAGEPGQLAQDARPVPLRVVDLSSLAELAPLFGAEFGHGFDLARDSVWRALLVRLPGEEHVLLMAVHHIASDGWSSVLLANELSELCEAASSGRDPQLAELPIQYADYAVWQRRWLTDTVLEPHLIFWRQTLDGLMPLPLPTDRARPAVRDSRGATVAVNLPPLLTGTIIDLGRARGATPFMTLLTAFAVLLAHYSGQWDVPVGTPVAGRTRPEVSGVVGVFLNSLVLRCRLSPGLSFEEALDRVGQTSRSALAHQDLPFSHLVDDLRPARDLSRTPLYQVMFDLLDEGVTSTALPDLDGFADAWRVAKTDLTLYLYLAADGGMTGVFEYATALFDEHTVTRMAGRFLTLLDAVAADPGAPLSKVVGALDAPTGVVERRMAAIWSELLGEEVGVDQNFFQIGGNSTLALRLVASVQEEFELDLPVRLIFEQPTVARLAVAVEDRIRAEITQIDPATIDALLAKEPNA